MADSKEEVEELLSDLGFGVPDWFRGTTVWSVSGYEGGTIWRAQLRLSDHTFSGLLCALNVSHCVVFRYCATRISGSEMEIGKVIWKEEKQLISRATSAGYSLYKNYPRWFDEPRRHKPDGHLWWVLLQHFPSPALDRRHFVGDDLIPRSDTAFGMITGAH